MNKKDMNNKENHTKEMHNKEIHAKKMASKGAKKALMILGHPDLESSLANKTIVHELSNISNLEIRHLAKLYPDFNIDVESEQAALLASDIIILQYPFYWYNVTPILKQWIDKVLSYGFAYGGGGDKLKGKQLYLSFTTGGPAEAYKKGGYNNFTFEELSRPLEQTANLCQMHYKGVISSSSMISFSPEDEKKQEIISKAKAQASKIKAIVG